MKIDTQSPFHAVPGAPAPLVCRIRKRVLFGECDPMGVLWHGSYAAYLEAAREALASTCGISFRHFQESGVALPMKTLFLDYCKPLLHSREYVVEAAIHWSDAARVNMGYRILDEDEQLMTKGFSIQLMVDAFGSLILDPPPFFRRFIREWASNALDLTSGRHSEC